MKKPRKRKTPAKPPKPAHVVRLNKLAADPSVPVKLRGRIDLGLLRSTERAPKPPKPPKPVELDAERFKDLEAHLAALGPAKGKTKGPNAWYFLGQEPPWQELINAGFNRREVEDHCARQGYDAKLILD